MKSDSPPLWLLIGVAISAFTLGSIVRSEASGPYHTTPVVRAAQTLAAPVFTGTATGVNLLLSGTLGVSGQTTFTGVTATGNVGILGTLGVSGAVTTSSTLTTGGNVQITGQAWCVQPATNTTGGTSQTINWNSGNGQIFDAQGSSGSPIVFTFTNPNAGASYVLKLIQGSSARTYTWPTEVKWPAGTAPTVTVTDNAVDVVSCYYDGALFLCTAVLDVR